MLLRLYYDYILEDNEKNLKDILKLNEFKSEKEKELNYLLHSKKDVLKTNNEKSSVELVEVKKENVFKKIFRKLKNFFEKIKKI